ncbi:MAG: hypothetical protein ABFS10_13000, partial [Bacteroidota bacterium]
MRITILLLLLSISSLIKAKEPDCEVISYVTNISVENGKKRLRRSHLIQVNNRDGELFNPISIHFRPGVSLSDVKAQIETVDGKIIR